MRRQIFAVCVGLACLAGMSAHAIERVYAAVQPDTDVMMYLDGVKSLQKPFTKAIQAFSKAHEDDEWLKKQDGPKGANAADMKELQAIGEKLGLKEGEDWLMKMVGTMSFLRGEDGSISGVKDFVLAFEFIKPLDIKKAYVLCKQLAAQKKAKVNLSLQSYKKLPLVKVTSTEPPHPDQSFDAIYILAADAKLVFIGTEHGCQSALERYQTAKIIDMDGYFKGLTCHDFFLGIKMQKEISAMVTEKSADMPALAPLAKADGISLTMDVSDAVEFTVRAALQSDADAQSMKVGLWDNFLNPMMKIYTPNLKTEMGGEFPLLDSFKGSAAGSVFAIGCRLTMKDVQILFDFAKKRAEMQAMLNAPIPQEPAQQAPVKK